jgi:hypothetical protein
VSFEYEVRRAYKRELFWGCCFLQKVIQTAPIMTAVILFCLNPNIVSRPFSLAHVQLSHQVDKEFFPLKEIDY